MGCEGVAPLILTLALDRSEQLHMLVILPQKGTLGTSAQETEWAPELVCFFGQVKIMWSLPGIEARSQGSKDCNSVTSYIVPCYHLYILQHM